MDQETKLTILYRYLCHYLNVLKAFLLTGHAIIGDRPDLLYRPQCGDPVLHNFLSVIQCIVIVSRFKYGSLIAP